MGIHCRRRSTVYVVMRRLMSNPLAAGCSFQSATQLALRGIVEHVPRWASRSVYLARPWSSRVPYLCPLPPCGLCSRLEAPAAADTTAISPRRRGHRRWPRRSGCVRCAFGRPEDRGLRDNGRTGRVPRCAWQRPHLASPRLCTLPGAGLTSGRR